jgi:hypothetical protein
MNNRRSSSRATGGAEKFFAQGKNFAQHVLHYSKLFVQLHTSESVIARFNERSINEETLIQVVCLRRELPGATAER